MIHISNLTKQYPGVNPSLKNVDLEVERGEFVFVTGLYLEITDPIG